MPHLSKEQKGIICALIACIFFGLLNCVIRKTSQFLDPVVMITYRSMCCVFITIPLLAFVPRERHSFSLINRTNIYKAVVDLLSMPLWATAITYMHITQVVALSFTTPVFVAVMAVFFLQDKPTTERWLALLLGLIGVYVVLIPDSNGFNYYSIFVLTACFLWATGSIFTKNLTNKQHPILIVLYSNTLIFCASLVLNYDKLFMPNLEQIFFILALSTLAALSNLSIAYAYKHTRISVVIPFDYTRLVFTTIFAFIFFGEVIKINTIIGSLIILFSVFVVANHTLYLKLRSVFVSKS